ncbi:MAG: hypothetical protein ACRC2T_03245, partial [Thermoguttaceae bacterium]
NNPKFDDENVDLSILSACARYHSLPGIDCLADFVKKGHKSDCYKWGLMLDFEPEEIWIPKRIVTIVGNVIPSDKLGNAYLQMVNQLMINEPDFLTTHPFDCEKGTEFLAQLLQKADEYGQEIIDFSIDAVVAILFLRSESREKLFPIALSHPNGHTRVEAAWVGVKIGDKRGETLLIEMAANYRYASRALHYMSELGIEDKIPDSSKTPEFQALAEMAQWLEHPSEMAKSPTELTIIDSRTLFWPPKKKELNLFIVRYLYEGENVDGTDEIGVGLVGSMTFCLFDKSMNDKTPEEIYAIHCDFEMQQNDPSHPEIGMKLLRESNPNFNTS